MGGLCKPDCAVFVRRPVNGAHDSDRCTELKAGDDSTLRQTTVFSTPRKKLLPYLSAAASCDRHGELHAVVSGEVKHECALVISYYTREPRVEQATHRVFCKTFAA